MPRIPNSRTDLRCAALAAVLAICGWVMPAAAEMPFDLGATIAVGGWQEREEVSTNHKGKTTDINLVWMGIVGKEMRDGKSHVWLEMRMQNFKSTRGGGRKPKGEPTIMKSLIEETAFSDFTDPMSSMRKFGKEIIIQNGREQPMRIREGGMMADMALKSFGGSMDFDFDFDTAKTTESVTVPAGTFDAHKISGTGSMEINMVIRKMRVESQTVGWYSKDVPLGMIKQETQSTTNGKPSQTKSELIRHGESGARSMVNHAAIKDMPAFGGFGRG